VAVFTPDVQESGLGAARPKWLTGRLAGHRRVTAPGATVFSAFTLGAAIAAVQIFRIRGSASTMAIGIAGENVILLVPAKRRFGVSTHAYVHLRAIAAPVSSFGRAQWEMPAGISPSADTTTP